MPLIKTVACLEPSSETTEFSPAAEKAAELEPGFCHRMLEFQIEYPPCSGSAGGRTEEPGCATVRDVRFTLKSRRDRSRHLHQSSAIRTSLEKVHGFAQGLGCSSALPCAETVFHSLDYRIELISFRNRIRYG